MSIFSSYSINYRSYVFSVVSLPVLVLLCLDCLLVVQRFMSFWSIKARRQFLESSIMNLGIIVNVQRVHLQWMLHVTNVANDMVDT